MTQPAYWSNVDPAPRRSRRTLVIAVVVAAVLLMCAVPVTGFIAWRYLGPDLDDAKAAAGRYFERITAGDDTAAYAMLCAQARQRTDLAAFTALVDQAPRPTARAVTAGRFRGEAGHEATIDVRLTTAGTSREVSVEVTDREGGWLICGATLI